MRKQIHIGNHCRIDAPACRVNRRNTGLRQAEGTGRHWVGTGDARHRCAAWTLRCRPALVDQHTVPQGIRRHNPGRNNRLTNGVLTPFIIHEEEKPILLDRSTDRTSRNVSYQLWPADPIQIIEEGIRCRAGGAIVPAHVSMKVFGPALSHQSNLGSSHQAIGRVGVGGCDAKLLHRIEGYREGARKCSLVLPIVGIHTVQRHVRLVAADPINSALARIKVLNRSHRQFVGVREPGEHHARL